MNEIIMEVTNVTKEYKMGEVTVHALRGVSLNLYAGEFVVVLGPSGSGKSTLLNIIGGIDKASSGTIMFDNKDIGNASDKELTAYRRHAVGFVFQFYNLIPNLTARENIVLAAEMSNQPIPPDELLKAVDLTDRANNFPTQLSGGQQQRVAIARAVSKNPSILLCDEPTGALDFTTGIQVLRILKDFNEKYKKTVIIITHNASIGQMANRILHVKDGLIDKIIVNENPISPEQVSW
ncbi:MAG: ABC transporter ATP-binding protein [Defluviitaleaceae bacterium]|nr:ABC transporter ATP-binding protein [Defluviitaleaceae bacterium]